MMENTSQTSRPGWKPLSSESMPRPTYFPSAMALGTTLIFLGVVTSWIISFAGASLFIFALAGWIKEIRYERKQQ